MQKTLKLIAGIIIFSSLILSCKDDGYLTKALPDADQSFTEEFDTVSSALARGWKIKNASDPLGSAIWQNGGDVLPIFNSYSNVGNNVGFIGCSYLSTNVAQGIISNWLISPEILMKNGDVISFYTRAQITPTAATVTPLTNFTDYANRMQLRLSPVGSSTDVGTGLGFGTFTIGIADINPTLTPYHSKVPGTYPDPITAAMKMYTNQTNALAYPAVWTRIEATVEGLFGPTMGRFAFRYFTEGAGSNGRANAIGIDKVSYKSIGY